MRERARVGGPHDRRDDTGASARRRATACGGTRSDRSTPRRRCCRAARCTTPPRREASTRATTSTRRSRPTRRAARSSASASRAPATTSGAGGGRIASPRTPPARCRRPRMLHGGDRRVQPAGRHRLCDGPQWGGYSETFMDGCDGTTLWSLQQFTDTAEQLRPAGDQGAGRRAAGAGQRVARDRARRRTGVDRHRRDRHRRPGLARIFDAPAGFACRDRRVDSRRDGQLASRDRQPDLGDA